jgi:DNA-binding IclR family transcriptional regulator
MESQENQLLLRIIKVMDCFNGTKTELSVLEISNLTGLPYSTAGRLLQNLKSVGLLNQDEKSKGYCLGSKVLSWAGSYLNKMDLLELSEPFLLDLHQKTLETISLYTLDHFERICIYRKESPHSIRMVARIGDRMPLHLGASGKFFLLKFSAEERDQYYSMNHVSDVDIQKLEKTLKEIKISGYTTSFGERVPEAASIAAPIYNLQKKIVAVVNISGPIQRFDSEITKSYTQMILETAQSISRALGFTGE